MLPPYKLFIQPASRLRARVFVGVLGFCVLALSLCQKTLGQKVIGLINFNQLQASPKVQRDPALRYRLEQWQRALQQLQGQTASEQLIGINDFFNTQLQFQSDQRIWQSPDYWATPLESLSRAAGDCEDFAIAKYISLLALGIAPEKLRLVYVKAKLPSASQNADRTQAHMVLAYYAEPNDIPLVLDNLIPTVRPANLRPDLKPVFSFNGQGLWLQGSQTAAVKNPESRLSRWRSVLERMRQQGIHHS